MKTRRKLDFNFLIIVIAGHVANALSKELVKEIQNFGLPAERAAGTPPSSGNILEIEGQFGPKRCKNQRPALRCDRNGSACRGKIYDRCQERAQAGYGRICGSRGPGGPCGRVNAGERRSVCGQRKIHS